MASQAASSPSVGDRPAISVVIPFGRKLDAAEAMLGGLDRLLLRPGDELIVADNSRDQVVPRRADGPVTVLAAERERSSYYARNCGGERAENDWLLFIDDDCRPDPGLLDALFVPAPGDRCGVVAGGVVGAPGQRRLLARWALSRRHLSEEVHVSPPPEAPHPAGITANLLVRREVWESLGGFHEGVQSGADVELCWRVQDAGWLFEHRPRARVEHVYATGWGARTRQAARYNAGRLWVRRRYPGAFPRPRLVRPLARCAAGIAAWGLTGRFERAMFKLIDAVSITGSAYGWYLGSNQATREDADAQPAGSSPAPAASTEAPLLVMVDAFPARSETFVYNEVQALQQQGRRIRVESSVRPARTERSVARALPISYLEDDPPRRKALDLGWLFIRHPFRCARDLRDRRRWRRQEETWGLAALAPAARRLAAGGESHIHAHFAAGAALHAMRLSRLLGLSYSLTAHAYDIFQKPANLVEKLDRAAFAAAECEYTARHMRSLLRNGQSGEIHRVATGVDASRFRRRTRYGRGGHVVAVGRHVEKKGFPVLLRAVASMRGNPDLESLTIAGEGPLRAALEELVDELDLGGLVALPGNTWGAEGVGALLEEADILVIPAVLADDGDRDALPVISYEALAMEVPVIASDLVGLPEVVRPPWGRLVPPGEPRALAGAIAELLALPVAERAEMGRRGRQFVLEDGNPKSEVERLGELLSAAGSPGPRQRRAGLLGRAGRRDWLDA